MSIKKKQMLSIIFGVVGGLGTIATALLVRKAAKKEIELNRSDLDLKEYRKEMIKNYIPSVLVGSATITSTIISNVLSRKVEASLVSAAMIADQGWRRYKNEVKSIFGVGANENVLKELAKKDSNFITDPNEGMGLKRLYYEEHIGFFKADPERFAYAYADMNQRLAIIEPGESWFCTMLWDLLKQSDAEVLDENFDPEEALYGWSDEYLQDIFGYNWIHMTIHNEKNDEGVEYSVIEWGEEPIFNPGNYCESKWEELESGQSSDDAPGEFLTVLDSPKNYDILNTKREDL